QAGGVQRDVRGPEPGGRGGVRPDDGGYPGPDGGGPDDRGAHDRGPDDRGPHDRGAGPDHQQPGPGDDYDGPGPAANDGGPRSYAHDHRGDAAADGGGLTPLARGEAAAHDR